MADRGALLAALRERMVEASARGTGDAAACAEAAVEPYSPLLPAGVRGDIVRRLVADAAGVGPLERLLADPAVDEVMVNGPGEVWVERFGRLERTEARFDSVEALRDSIDRILAASGRRADDLSPLADARLPDGSRVNVALPPLAVDGPIVTIRRFRSEGICVQDLIDSGTLPVDGASLLGCAVEDGLNILVSGATGSGKTTTLGALARLIPADERVVTIEDAAELRFPHPHLVRLEARPAMVAGTGAVGIRDLVRNSLRMRPDRIVVGEVRGAEAADMLDAMSTGHSGSLSTVHAGSPHGALERLASLAQMAALGLPHAVITERISAVIDLVVQQERLLSGRRVVRSVSVVDRDSPRGVEEILRFTGDSWTWRTAGSAMARRRLRFE